MTQTEDSTPDDFVCTSHVSQNDSPLDRRIIIERDHCKVNFKQKTPLTELLTEVMKYEQSGRHS